MAIVCGELRMEPRAFYRLTIGELRCILHGRDADKRGRRDEHKAALSWLLVGQGWEPSVVREKVLGLSPKSELDDEERKKREFAKMMRKAGQPLTAFSLDSPDSPKTCEK